MEIAKELESIIPIEEYQLALIDNLGKFQLLVTLEDEGKTLEELSIGPYQLIRLLRENQINYIFNEKKPTDNYHSSKGITGLVNLGNTCYMNSALQCLAHTKPLVQYLLNDTYKKELNRVNVLGTGGKLASSFGSLIKELWNASNSVAPREFKHNIGLFAPQFSGYAQHDSQEFISFLLDGLHEDLNRIIKKPYIEIPDPNGRSEVIVAKEAWELHLSRNDSIVVDLFQGQFKSTVVCPECSYLSNTFDPFMYLSLPLPTSSTQRVTVVLVFKSTEKLPKEVQIII